MIIIDSANIAARLEELYAEPPLHLDLGLHIEAKKVMFRIWLPIFPVLMPLIRDRMITAHALPYWIKTREALFGMTVDEFAHEKGGQKAWDALYRSTSELPSPLKALSDFLKDHKRDRGPFVLGSRVSYADLVIVGELESARRTDEAIFDTIVDFDGSIRELWEECGSWLKQDT